MEKHENEDRSVSPSERYTKDFEPASPPISPDGGIAPGWGSEPDLPALDVANSMCRQGPCRYYWHLVTEFPSGNPESTWKDLGIRKPRQHNHTCLVHSGMETELNEDFVHECSRWDPLTSSEKAQIDVRRRLFLATQPQEEIDDGSEDTQG